jgi:hypothetical protein
LPYGTLRRLARRILEKCRGSGGLLTPILRHENQVLNETLNRALQDQVAANSTVAAGNGVKWAHGRTRGSDARNAVLARKRGENRHILARGVRPTENRTIIRGINQA